MRNRIVVLLVVLLATVLTACEGGQPNTGDQSSGSSGGGKEGSPPPSDVSATLKIWSYNDPKDYPYVHKWIDRFNKKYPHVKVDWVWIEQQRLTSKLLGSAISGDLPDGLFFNPASAPQLADGDILRDLTPYWNKYKYKNEFPDSVVTSYKKKTVSVQPYVNIDAIWYNKDILKKLGDVPPQDSMSVKKFEKILADAKEKNYTGLTLGCQGSEKGEFQALPWLLGAGVNYGNFEQDPTARVFNRLAEWTKKGYIPKDCTAWTGAVAFQKCLGGKVAFAQSGNWWLSKAKKDADFDFGVMPMPTDTDGSHSVPGGEGVGITQQTKHPALMWEFWKIALSRRGELTSLKTNGTIPARKDLADAPVIQKSQVLRAYTKVIKDAKSRPASPKTYKAMQTLGTIFNGVIGGEMNGSTAAQKLRQKTADVG